MKTYEFILANGGTVRAKGDDLVSAYHSAKKSDKISYFRIKKFDLDDPAPEGFSLFGIGYGLSIAYRVV